MNSQLQGYFQPKVQSTGCKSHLLWEWILFPYDFLYSISSSRKETRFLAGQACTQPCSTQDWEYHSKTILKMVVKQGLIVLILDVMYASNFGDKHSIVNCIKNSVIFVMEPNQIQLEPFGSFVVRFHNYRWNQLFIYR